jgi:hypothetical protein
MAHTGIFATKAQCDAAVGENVDTTGWTEANINSWCLMSESIINSYTRYNWSDAYGTLNVDVKYILSAASAAWVAMQGITYNMSGYSSRIEAETMLDVHRDWFLKCIDLLVEQKVKDFMVNA